MHLEQLRVDCMYGDINIFDTGTYYGDASGGQLSSYPTIRRCGVGLVSLFEEQSISMSCNFTLPGAVHTVPRGEIYTLVFFLSRACPGSNLEYITDHKGLYDTFQSGPAAGAV